MCDKGVENYTYALITLTGTKTKKRHIHPSTIKFVPQCYKTQQMCYKAVHGCFSVFDSIPDQYKT